MRIHKSTHDTEVKYCVREMSRNITSFLDHTVIVTQAYLLDYSIGSVQIQKKPVFTSVQLRDYRIIGNVCENNR